MKLAFVWSPSARNDLRGIEKEAAMRILRALTRYAESGEGNVKALKENSPAHIAFGSGIGGFDFAA